MKYMFLIAAALLGSAALSQTAFAGDCPGCAAGADSGYGAPGYGYEQQGPGYGPRVEAKADTSERYGVISCLRWGWWKKSDSCCGVAHVHGKCNTCNVPQPAPQQLQGTLVFPVNPFVRSPRDFFMWEAK